MSRAVYDLYSPALLSRNAIPVFHNYYNIEFRDGFVMPFHSHEYIEIMYVKKGSCEIFAEDKRYKMEAGDVVLINGDIPHRLLVDKNVPCRVLCLEFNFIYSPDSKYTMGYIYKDVKEVRHFLSQGKGHIKLKDSSEIYNTLSDIYRELEQDKPGKDLLIEASFCSFIIKFARLWFDNEKVEKNPWEKYIKDALSYMKQNYCEELSVKQIARHVNLNSSYFHKIFKQATGLTPGEFLNNIRINKAKMLLEKSDIPIIDICNYVGFNSRQYFSYAFKKSIGVTPRQYRKQSETKRVAIKANRSCFQ